MRIRLFRQHQGLGQMLADLFEDHEVILTDEYPAGDFQEDVYISTMTHGDLNSLKTDKPVICYLTDPVYYNARTGFEYWLQQANFTIVGAEDCYPAKYVYPYNLMIPYAINSKKYPEYKYNGRINKILIVNAKPDARLVEITRGLWKKEFTLAQFLEGLPYEWAHEPDITKFRQMYADYKVLFYYSNSPYTIVMFEAMTVGIPIIALNWCYGGWTSVIEKYLPRRSQNYEEIKTWLKQELDKLQPERIVYQMPPFIKIKKKWNDLFKKVMK